MQIKVASKLRIFITILTFTFSLLILFVLNACRTAEPASKPVVVVKLDSPSLEPLLIDWAGTAWLLPETNPNETNYGNFPGYKALYFGRDGLLFLINMDNAEGGRWKAEGANLTLSMQKGVPDIELGGEFLVRKHSPDSSTKSTAHALLKPLSGTESIVLTKVTPNVNMIENRWIPQKLEGDQNVLWPIDRETSFIILPDAVGGLSLLGFIGDTRFQGFFSLGEEIFKAGELIVVQRSAPPSSFENLYKNQLSRANRYVQVNNDLFLFINTKPIASFRIGMFN